MVVDASTEVGMAVTFVVVVVVIIIIIIDFWINRVT